MLAMLRANLPAAITPVFVATLCQSFARATFMPTPAGGKLSLVQIEWNLHKYTLHRRAGQDAVRAFVIPVGFTNMPQSSQTDGED